MSASERFSARFKTDDLPAATRVETVRTALLSKQVPFDIGPLHNNNFFTDMFVQELPGLEITMGEVRAKAVRNASIIKDGNDDLLFSMCIDGNLEIQQRKRRTSVPPGTAYIGWCAEPIVFDTDVSRGVSLRIPRSAISVLVPGIDDLVGHHLPHNQEVLRLIDVYMRSFEKDAFYDTPGLGRIAVSHVHDLVSLAIGTDRETTNLAQNRGMGAARTLALKKDIVHLIGPQDVTIDLLAKRHGISPRYIRRLFEVDGTTLTAFVLEERLRMARKLLLSPRQPFRPIRDIAEEVGFTDISYFNRCFRMKFGMTPTEYRLHGEY
jgi:AraC-like DNA-binding protein